MNIYIFKWAGKSKCQKFYKNIKTTNNISGNSFCDKNKSNDKFIFE